MKQIYIILLFLFTLYSTAQTQIRHGAMTTVGKSSMRGLKHNISEDFWNELARPTWIDTQSYYNLTIGYRFRLQPPNKKFFYDADMTVGFKKMDYGIDYEFTEKYQSIAQDGTYYYFSMPRGLFVSYHVSLALSCNYIIYKGLYAGAGIIPSYRYKEDASIPPLANKFDMPVFAKIGYDFKFIDIAFSYQLGLTNMMQDKYIKQGRINDWQLQLFIPF